MPLEDPEAEIIIASVSAFLVVDTDGSILSTIPIDDPWAGATPCAADHDQDGRAEIIFKDVDAMRALRIDGTDLWSIPSTDSTMKSLGVRLRREERHRLLGIVGLSVGFFRRVHRPSPGVAAPVTKRRQRRRESCHDLHTRVRYTYERKTPTLRLRGRRAPAGR